MKRWFPPCIVIGFVIVAAGCRDAPLAENVRSNVPPVAHAGDAQVLAFTGVPVRVTLDATQSSDADGAVIGYRWLSGNKGDGGIGRDVTDPEDIASPSLDLGEGVWVFTLYVFDNHGGVSLPTTVTIRVGAAQPPEVTECTNDALATIAQDCRSCICSQSEMCRSALAACDQACWDLYGCVQNQCGDLIGSDQDELANCVRASCTNFFSGVGGYMALAPCLSEQPCAAMCAESVRI
jgi:hypothetical protein